jgi:arylsulfatase
VGELADRPNILFFDVDNLGFGELSCYGGGPLCDASLW